ncbi:glycosyltransferase [Phycicoccus sp. 3266]|uniref:glycosyltransferase n=1 Tax=Phycicoccus sp. 3266 TaxID=2817751 RepID=UPI002856655E|nr:glycosyltransferase [Phycicoccus sp. 3266]MDR6862273.1 glycosyltransferase involved in cell wall biosynthesis [Phycicoccus sp. 3266]
MRVVQWAQEHGEVGGVMNAHSELTRLLRGEGHEVRYVDTGSARRALAAAPGLWRRSLHVFHITRLWRAVVMAPLFAVLPGHSILVLHSGSTHLQLQRQSALLRAVTRLSLRAYDEVWAVSGQIREALPPGLRDRVSVVRFPVVVGPAAASAEDAGATGPAPAASRDPHAVSVATNAGQWYYHADLAVEAVQQVRQEWPDATLRILAYGDDGADMARLRELVGGLPWVTLSFDAGPQEVASVLERSGVFLRPTAWDGDSLIVREAQGAGARVVASDTCPRAAGVELSALTAPALAEAILRGGEVSDGAGLAETTMEQAALRAVAALGDRRR